MFPRVVKVFLFSSCFINCALAKDQLLYDFLSPNTSTIKLLNQGSVLPSNEAEQNQQGESLRRLTFTTDTNTPQVSLDATQVSWNFKDEQALSIRIQNAMDWDIGLFVDIKDVTQKTLLRATVDLPAGPAQDLLIPLKTTSGRGWGMRQGVTTIKHIQGRYALLPSNLMGKIDLSKVASITLWINKPNIPQSILLGKVQVVDENVEQLAYSHLVDQYGQNTRMTWPDKVTSDQQLQQMAQAEQGQVADWLKQGLATDQYGGLIDKNHTFKATNYFRTEKYKGRWFFISPEGHVFISLGVNSVVPDHSQTYIADRDFMFASLPDSKSPLANFYGYSDTHSNNAAQAGRGVDKGTWYDFYQANLYRTNSNNILESWRDRTISRFKAWGFNTIGNWSDKQLIDKKQLPYTMPILIKGDYAGVSSGMDWWGQMPDTFDPKFIQAVEKAVALATKHRVNDPWLVGYFADNELSWGGIDSSPKSHYALAINSLALDMAHSPAKQAFIKQLRIKYGDVNKFNAAWGVSVKSWQDIEQQAFKAPLPSQQYPAIEQDYSAFLKQYADNYFKTVKQMLAKYDPNHLLLGNRFASKLPEVVTSCAQYSDVISFNIYTLLPNNGYDTKLIADLDKPIMITEFSFGSKATGALWGGPMEVANDETRSNSYQQFVSTAFNDPHMVGLHWFQYIDEPLTGRLLDGENGNMGLVAITDRPYQNFIKKVRETNLKVLQETLNKL